MDIENYQESCAACGSRTIHFVIEPPFLSRYCARCGRDNSVTWGRERLPEYQGPEFDRLEKALRALDEVIARLQEPARVTSEAGSDVRIPDQVKVGTPAPVKPWDELSNFERSLHFGPDALHT